MTTNVDVGLRMSLDSEWELFGGEIKLSGIDSDIDSVALHADSSEEVGWQAEEDDVLSVCSSATSWSCLHGTSLLETCSEMYSDLCKDEGDDEFDRLLPSELIADIASCMNDDLPVSLEQFYEINRLIDADAEVESNASHPLLFGPDTVNSEVVRTVNSDARELESCDSDVVDASAMLDNSETFLFTVGDAIGEMDGTTSPESEMASIECEELYEESVSAEDVSSTISCEELQALMTSNCDRSVVKYEPSEDTETCRRSWCHPPTELTGNRRLRKKEQNKSAALRYRLKKRSEQGLVMTEYALLERRNIELRTRLDAMTKEISYLKSLIDELCPRDCA